MALIRDKRAIFFTFMAIFVVTALYFYFWANQPLEVRASAMPAGEKPALDRARDINDDIVGMRSTLLSRALIVSGYNALGSIIAYEVNETEFVENLTKTFEEVILNGTIDSTPLTSYGIDFMQDTTLPRLMELIKNSTESFMKISVNFTITSVRAEQNNETGPWLVAVIMNVTMNVTSEVATWNMNQSITAFLHTEDLEDPLYAVKTGNIHRNWIRRTNLTGWNVTLLNDLIGSREYKHESLAPSLLQRIENGSNSSVCCGIESMVWWDSDVNLSYVDYCFLVGKCIGSDPLGNLSLYNVTSITTPAYRFKIETYHTVFTKYNLSGYLVPI